MPLPFPCFQFPLFSFSSILMSFFVLYPGPFGLPLLSGRGFEGRYKLPIPSAKHIGGEFEAKT